MYAKILTCFLLLLTTGTAQAYVLPAIFLMRTLSENRRAQRVKDLTVHLKTEITGQTEALEERVYLKMPGNLRREFGHEGLIYVERAGHCASGTTGKLKRHRGPPVELLATLLTSVGRDLDETSAHMIRLLQSVGVDTQIVTMAKLDDEVAYVIGANPWDQDRPQVWIDKNTFFPVRVIMRVDGQWRDRHYKEYGSSISGNWFPRVIEDYVGNTLMRHSEVIKIEVNRKLPNTLFDLGS